MINYIYKYNFGDWAQSPINLKLKLYNFITLWRQKYLFINNLIN